NGGASAAIGAIRELQVKPEVACPVAPNPQLAADAEGQVGAVVAKEAELDHFRGQTHIAEGRGQPLRQLDQSIDVALVGGAEEIDVLEAGHVAVRGARDPALVVDRAEVSGRDQLRHAPALLKGPNVLGRSKQVGWRVEGIVARAEL